MALDPVVERLYGTTDATIWAEEFMRIVRTEVWAKGHQIDEGLMVGWFANAMYVAERAADRDGSDAEQESGDL